MNLRIRRNGNGLTDSKTKQFFFGIRPVRKGWKGGEKPIMGRPRAGAHRCVRLARTKNFLKNLNLQWRKRNAMTHHHLKRGLFVIVMPSARNCPMGVFRRTPRHRRSREVYRTD
ncbi:hypothetical protein EVAR_46395_1 [Eumeta japonica]|uniref:Uncharacterized protein n=1 Tax=Eumeta variegata TaxID=151549 RepID=A0A4C1WUJ5_EUMVA|nr:hypothetical protein EVAR_46395_1 [Eumeta japonica]